MQDTICQLNFVNLRKSGKVELENKTVVPSEEFRLNWMVEK